jgi:hypothetical protein
VRCRMLRAKIHRVVSNFSHSKLPYDEFQWRLTSACGS